MSTASEHHGQQFQFDRNGAQEARANKNRLSRAIGVTATVMIAEAVGGAFSNSLALMADAGHMLIDLLGLVVALIVAVWGARPADSRRTFGYRRLEILGALANSVTLVLVSGSIAYEAIQRFRDPVVINLRVMMGIAGVGLAANLLGLWFLGQGQNNVNIRGAFLHLLGDTLSSVGVLAGGAIMALTGWSWVDPLLSVALSVLIAVSSYRLLSEVVDVLLEAVPPGIDLEEVSSSIQEVAGVSQIHDLHVWSITSGMPALSAHIVLDPGVRDSDPVLRATLAVLRGRFHIEHATLQVERTPDLFCGCPPQSKK